ncbi:YdcF family protein [Streptomonospora sp. S1-112]|uniref:YdcF family protein n=1 Tax=Streptomonospora mangrovi TaxID=2883123 RepID=A0A9X3SDN5_9ACTN|nr:YdcF family protein [Streptomonospora mangrovi]MDA0564042.1 YdcF family protein [Streptomonospora mangrovi]
MDIRGVGATPVGGAEARTQPLTRADHELPEPAGAAAPGAGAEGAAGAPGGVPGPVLGADDPAARDGRAFPRRESYGGYDAYAGEDDDRADDARRESYGGDAPYAGEDGAGEYGAGREDGGGDRHGGSAGGRGRSERPAADSGADTTRTLERPRTAAPPDDPPPPRGRGPARPARPPRRRLRIGRIIVLLLLVAIATPPATWGWVWYTARADERPASDAIVVLGASQYNGRPSPIFEARLAHAETLYREGVAPMIVTVGGNQPGDNFTEAGSGRDWLVAQGVPAENVVAVDEGNDTLQSMRAVARVYAEQGWSSAVIVSDPWHSLRSRVMAEDFGIEAATSPARSGPAVLERRTQVWYITRETASLWYYWIFGDSSDIEVDAA